MGYAYYVLADGREAGYAVEALCGEEHCTEEIDRGLGYLCGQTPGGDEYGCGGYYCSAHLFYGSSTPHGLSQLCKRCLAALEPLPDGSTHDG